MCCLEACTWTWTWTCTWDMNMHMCMCMSQNMHVSHVHVCMCSMCIEAGCPPRFIQSQSISHYRTPSMKHSGPPFTLIWSSFEPSVRSEHLLSCQPRSPASPVAVGIASPHKRCSASFAVHLSSACRRCMVHVDLLRGGVDTTNHQWGY